VDRLLTPDFQGQPWWWEAAPPGDGSTAELPTTTDVCIVGGGYTGLGCALELARSGASCVVLDAQRIGEGASSRNGGLVTGGVKLAAADHAAQLGKERARRLSAEAIGTLQFIEDLIRREGINCDFARAGRFTCAWSRGHYDAMSVKTERLAELTGEPVYMVPAERQREEIGSDYYRGGQVIEAAATLHPAKYVRGLAAAAAREGAVLVGGVQVRALTRQGRGWLLATDRGTVRAETVMIGTNGYTGPELPWFRRRVVPVASFMVATEELSPDLTRELVPKARALADSCRVLSYFRLSPDHTRVLWGGRVGTAAMDPRISARRLHAIMCKVWPQLKNTRISHSWTGNVAFTFDFLPHLGSHEGIHYALGCQGNGVAMQSWLGNRAARAILGGNSESAFADLTFPSAPLYSGNPWFLPGMLLWYRVRDRIDRMAA
jgi:glycine/D-amino acid oxidase-like deaminating enzyme